MASTEVTSHKFMKGLFGSDGMILGVDDNHGQFFHPFFDASGAWEGVGIAPKTVSLVHVMAVSDIFDACDSSRNSG
jgi:hypothetical protein